MAFYVDDVFIGFLFKNSIKGTEILTLLITCDHNLYINHKSVCAFFWFFFIVKCFEFNDKINTKNKTKLAKLR